MCFQLTHFPCDDWENIYTLSYYHHQIGSMKYYPLFRVRSWNNGVRCMSLYSLECFGLAILWGLYVCCSNTKRLFTWVSYQIADCTCAGNVFFPAAAVSDPDMHHGTWVTHVPWCMSGWLTSCFLWRQWRRKRSRHSRRMHKPQFYVSGKRPIDCRGLIVISSWFQVI